MDIRYVVIFLALAWRVLKHCSRLRHCLLLGTKDSGKTSAPSRRERVRVNGMVSINYTAHMHSDSSRGRRVHMIALFGMRM